MCADPPVESVEIARHIKSSAPRTLVADGSYARTLPINQSYALEALRSEYVNIFAGHHYNGGSIGIVLACFEGANILRAAENEFLRIAEEAEYIKSFKKV